MKKGLFLLIIYALSFTTFAEPEPDQRISHVILVWLKEPGNQQMRRQFISASNQLSGLPGIVSRHVGIVAPSERGIVDDTFDVGITITLENKKALQAYLQHPKHKKILKEQLKPLVNRVVAYDFVSE